MENTKKIVAVAGATGRTGAQVVRELLDRREFEVRALVRSAERAAWITELGALVVEVDIASQDSVAQALSGARYVISALGSKKPFSPKEFSMTDNRFQHLRHDFSLAAIEDVLFLLC